MSEIPHPNITRLVVKNYRSLKDIDVRLQPLTVLVGENGSGKSNLIDVLRFVRDALLSGLPQAYEQRGGMNALRCWFADEGEPISIHLEFEGPEWSGEYGFAFDNGQEEVELLQETFKLTTKVGPQISFEVVNGVVTQASPSMIGKASNKLAPQESLYLANVAHNSPFVQAVHDFLAKMNFYDFIPKELRQPQPARPPFPLSETGDNLASTLLELQRSNSDWMIKAFLEVIAEDLVGVGVEQVNGHLVTKLRYIYPMGVKLGMGYNSIESELKDEADGTIQLLALLTAFYQKRYPSPLVVEKPEKAIYSRALGVCSDAVKAARQRYQILITTHSPDLIDDLPAKSFLVLEKEAGISKIGPLSYEQQEAIADNAFSLGELMQIEGLLREGASWLRKYNNACNYGLSRRPR